MSIIHYSVSEEDIKQLSHYHALQQKGYRESLVRHKLIWPGMLLIAAAYAYFFASETYLAIAAVVLAVFWNLFIPQLIKYLQAKPMLTSIRAQKDNPIIGNHVLQAKKKYLVAKFNGEEKIMEWDSLYRIEITEHFSYIYLGMKSALIIPKASITEGDYEKFTSMVEKYIP